MNKPKLDEKFVGIQVSPISFVDEGVDAVLDTLRDRVGVNVLMLGTVSWLGLKTGRSISHELDGWPDHGVPEPFQMKGGAYFQPNPAYYQGTFIKDFRSGDPQFDGKDILAMVIPEAHRRGMKVYIELMEPFFKYTGHGSTNTVDIPNLAQAMEIDVFGRLGAEPSTSHPGYRNWILSMIEDQVRSYDIDGVMWCNERNSPLDQLIQGLAPGDFSTHARREAMERGIDVEACRRACLNLYDFMQEAKAGKTFADGAFITFLRVLLDNPHALIWEKFWLERNKDLDRELYGLVKWCKPNLPFGLNVWNRNHFNIIRRAQWPWNEQTAYADWVKPITYQHQSGEVWAKELSFFQKTILSDFSPDESTAVLYRMLGLDEAPYASVVQRGMDPDTYVAGQCVDALRGVDGRAKVFMGIGIDAPRTRADQAKCTPDIAYRSVMATYRSGGHGIVLAPNYASMHLTNLDGVAKALTELGLKP
ncbi:family 10 glycosylhydrolase [Mesorhizobium sp. WSM4887]|uniref:family 10 glycosylhydrolase n=1 Tax=Mesorhizobium sp. WSM4887 TaxID=3038543 RepID=UPI0024172FD5|nr:family 10 glycosylhydrolase [Mesorhizobium sp. WSM4887]MDG4889771.1 family 10 glycosylhydrolase [Mesorhizobium sp. WSM4887]